jgi:lysine 6-dehydrogenase
MKVLVLGGAGAMGRAAVLELATRSEVTHIVVADIDQAAAEKVASEAAPASVEPRTLDVNDHKALVKAMKDADIVASAVGPYYRLGVPVARAAIEAGRNYVDICDDYDATSDILSLDSEAKMAGVTLLVGMGASPGITNLLALKGVREMDRAEVVKTAWVVSAAGVGVATEADAAAAPPTELDAATVHMIHACTGFIPTFWDNRWVRIPAFEVGETVEFAGLGPYQVFHLGHPEPITLPQFIVGLRQVSNVGALNPPSLNEEIRQLARGHREPLHPASDAPSGREFPPAGGLAVIVEGQSGRRRVRRSYALAGGGGEEALGGREAMAQSTGIPLAIGTVLLGGGSIHDKGALPPEACVDPDEFFRELESSLGRIVGRPLAFDQMIQAKLSEVG